MEVNSGIMRKCNISNVCYCCLKDCCVKDVSSEHLLSVQKEVYEIMLKDTFGIQMTAFEDKSARYVVCEDCISQIRQASRFKMMVLQSQKCILNYSADNSNINKLENGDIDDELKNSIKVELTNDDGFDHHNGCVDSDDNEISNMKIDNNICKENADNIKVDESRKKKAKIRRLKIKGEGQDLNREWSKLIERRGNGPILRENSLKLIANSSICVFQWDKSRYRCFCCKQPFSDMHALKEHTYSSHCIQDIEKKIISQQNRLVKVEISTIKCKLCSEKMADLKQTKEHLIKKHGVSFFLEEDLLVPFKINDNLICQICSEEFSVFRLLNIHMNKHFQKQVCHICGTGFSNLVFLNLHKSRSHRPLLCEKCDVTFQNKLDKKHHDVKVHGVKFERKKRFPCPYCEQRFYQENLRVLHLVEEHDMRKPEHKCSVCSKVFITKSLCNNHVKTVHKKEKRHECDVCHNVFYTKSDVLRHHVTHSGEKKYSCDICNSLFATKDSLRRHTKRSHVGLN